MKIIAAILLTILSFKSYSQAEYEISRDPKHPEVKVLRGTINKYLVANDTAFKWYFTNQKGYTPDSLALDVFNRNRDKVHFILFGGTWCDDTQYILPRFFKLQELSGVPDSTITFFAVNRKKEALGNIAAAFNITNVPTMIVMTGGKEAGRVVEYGKTGKWDKELAEIILSGLSKKP